MLVLKLAGRKIMAFKFIQQPLGMYDYYVRVDFSITLCVYCTHRERVSHSMTSAIERKN